MKKSNYKNAVIWIAKFLDKNKIKFHFMGGLAAHVYGSKIRYTDIDLAMDLKDMNKLSRLAKPYVLEKLWCGASSNKIWTGYIMKLRYEGIIIDVTEAKNTKIFNKKVGKYERFPADVQHPTIKKVFGLNVPVMPKKNLVYYKSILLFPHDKLDLKYLKWIKPNFSKS